MVTSSDQVLFEKKNERNPVENKRFTAEMKVLLETMRYCVGSCRVKSGRQLRTLRTMRLNWKFCNKFGWLRKQRIWVKGILKTINSNEMKHLRYFWVLNNFLFFQSQIAILHHSRNVWWFAPWIAFITIIHVEI